MKLLEQVRQVARVKHFSYRAEQTYVHWIERFIRFHGIRHPAEMGAGEVEMFLTYRSDKGVRMSATLIKQKVPTP